MKYAVLVKAIQTASARSQGRAAVPVNQALVMRNWLVGEWILEFQQHGKDRVKYGTQLLETLAADLKAKKIKGFTAAVLRQCRLFCSIYPQIRQTPSVEFTTQPNSRVGDPRIPATLSLESAEFASPRTIEPVSPIRQTLSAELPKPLFPQALLQLSWSHLQKLFVSRNLFALPSVEKLRSFLEADRERIESLITPPATRKRAPRKPEV